MTTFVSGAMKMRDMNMSNVSKIIFDSEYLEDKGIGSLLDFV